MFNYIYTFLTYFIEFFSFFFLALKTLDKRFSFSLDFLGSAIFISIFFSISEMYILNPTLLYLLQIIFYLLCYKLYFREPMHIILYLYAYVFIINCFMQILTIIPTYFSNSIRRNPYTAILALLFTTLISYLLYRLVPLNRFFYITCNSKLSARLFFVNIYIILILIILFSKWNLHSFYEQFITILLIIFSIFCINLDMIYTHFKLQKTETELKAYEKYLPIVEGLIMDVRMKQHNFDNVIQSFAALPLTYNDFASLSNALEKFSKEAFQKNMPSKLLKLNYKLVAGFLHLKENAAFKQQKYLHITIKNFVLQTTVPEYTLMECIGILLDNALDAVTEGTIIPISIDSQNAKVIIEVTNPGPYIDDKLLEKMFQPGYTTKNVCSKEQHGLGLPFIHKTVKEYKGSIICCNKKQNGQNYITFKLYI